MRGGGEEGEGSGEKGGREGRAEGVEEWRKEVVIF